MDVLKWMRPLYYVETTWGHPWNETVKEYNMSKERAEIEAILDLICGAHEAKVKVQG